LGYGVSRTWDITYQTNTIGYYFPMRFKDREQCAMLSQLRLWDGKRLTHKMGQLPDDQFAAVKQALRRLLK
jgi:mRNA-degrading endonuclease toxin of MazEF toxin-antitoxin module